MDSLVLCKHKHVTFEYTLQDQYKSHSHLWDCSIRNKVRLLFGEVKPE